MLTQNGASIKKQKFINIAGTEYPVGEPWRRAYANTVQGRQQVQSEVPEPYKTAIFTVWGDTPTIESGE